MTSDDCYMYQGNGQSVQALSLSTEEYRAQINDLNTRMKSKMDNLKSLYKDFIIQVDQIKDSINNKESDYDVRSLNNKLESMYDQRVLQKHMQRVKNQLSEEKKMREQQLKEVQVNQTNEIKKRFEMQMQTIQKRHNDNNASVIEMLEAAESDISAISKDYDERIRQLNINFDEEKRRDQEKKLEAYVQQFKDNITKTEYLLSTSYSLKYDHQVASIKNVLDRSQSCIQMVESQLNKVNDNLYTLQNGQEYLQEMFEKQYIQLNDIRTQLQNSIQELQAQITKSTKQCQEFRQNKEYCESVISSKVELYNSDLQMLNNLQRRINVQKEIIKKRMEEQYNAQNQRIKKQMEACNSLIEQRKNEFNELEVLKSEQDHSIVSISQSIKGITELNKQQADVFEDIYNQYLQAAEEKQELYEDLNRLRQLCFQRA